MFVMLEVKQKKSMLNKVLNLGNFLKKKEILDEKEALLTLTSKMLSCVFE